MIYSSSSVVKDLHVQHGSNTGKFFSTFFIHLFYPVVTVLLEYFNPLFGFCLVAL